MQLNDTFPQWYDRQEYCVFFTADEHQAHSLQEDYLLKLSLRSSASRLRYDTEEKY